MEGKVALRYGSRLSMERPLTEIEQMVVKLVFQRIGVQRWHKNGDRQKKSKTFYIWIIVSWDAPIPAYSCKIRSAITMDQPSSRLPIEHIVLIVKENHGFDNYFGTFPGANGMKMPHSPNPPTQDPNHRHEAWLTRQTTAVRLQ